MPEALLRLLCLRCGPLLCHFFSNMLKIGYRLESFIDNSCWYLLTQESGSSTSYATGMWAPDMNGTMHEHVSLAPEK